MNADIKAVRQQAHNHPIPGLSTRFPLGLKIGFWLCIVIAVATVLRRIVALSTPPNPHAPPQLAALDAYFAAHATLTYVHIILALAFVVLLPLLFWHRTRNSPTLERTVFVIGALVGMTAYAMSEHAVGGWLERAAVLFFNTLFLFALYRAWSFARSGDRPQKQRWMLRAIAILLGIATTRPVMGIFFATAPLTHLTPQQFFGIAFWIGFSINTLVIELWLRTSPGRSRAGTKSASHA
jgi:putative flippase GtrA